jgi:long-chain acyl-CoA synthetase
MDDFDLAAMAIGAITVPIYSTNNAEQAEYIIKDSGTKVILVGNQMQYDACLELLHKEDNNLETIIVSKKAVWIKKEFSSFYLEDFIAKASKLEICKKEYEDTATLIYTSVPQELQRCYAYPWKFHQGFDSHFEFLNLKTLKKSFHWHSYH